MSETTLPPTTAGIDPEKFSDDVFFSNNRKVRIFFLLLFLLVGFGLRAGNLGAESLSEDELNKLQTVAEYRSNGLSGRNGEHPFLMKGLQTLSIIAFENWNSLAVVGFKVSEEAALRFPTALFGSFTILVLFLLVSELFGSTIGLVAAGLYAVDPAAIGFDRIAKEDSFLLFFLLLGNYFWLRSQSKADRGEPNWIWFCWLAAVAFGAMFASKYLPHILAIGLGYYTVLAFPTRKWQLGMVRWLTFLGIIGVSFVVFNPTILIPETWREMLTFSAEKRIGHHGYEFMGELYRNQMTLWLNGVPWTFYYVFIAVKTPLITLLFFLIGLPMMLKRRLGDGRYFLFFWALMWFMPFSALGGKFTRYFTLAEPLILIVSAVGFCFFIRWIADRSGSLSALTKAALQTFFFLGLISASLFASLSVAPHFRLHTNALGGGMTLAGSYFPHDEFYDTSTREIAASIAAAASPQARVANETPYLFTHYAEKAGRDDLIAVSLSDKSKVAELSEGDFIVVAKGRRYFSNDVYLNYLESSVVPFAKIKIGEITSARIYQLDSTSVQRVRDLAK